MPGKPPLPPSRRRILVVDDDDLMLTFYKSLFSRYQDEFSPVFAESGEEALSQLKTQKFDAAILDWDMPHLSGLNILKAIRANLGTRALRIVIVSGRTDPHDRTHALKSGADAFLSKPFEVEELLAFLRKSFYH